MTLKEAITFKDRITGQASSNVRALAFAGIGVVWILSQKTMEGLRADLLRCLTVFGVALVCDFLQYSVASVIWETFVWRSESKYKLDDDVHALARFNVPAQAFFWLKQLVVAAGYVLLIVALLDRLTCS